MTTDSKVKLSRRERRAQFQEKWLEGGLVRKTLVGFLTLVAIASVFIWPSALLHWIFKWDFGSCCLGLLFGVPILSLVSWLTADMMEDIVYKHPGRW